MTPICFFGDPITWHLHLFLVLLVLRAKLMIKGLEDTHFCSRSIRQLRSPFSLVFTSFFPKHSRRRWQLVPICTCLLPSYGKWLYRPTGSGIVYAWAKQMRFKDDWCAGLTPGPAEGLWRTHPAQRVATLANKHSSLLCGCCTTRWPALHPIAFCVPNSLCRLHKICYNWGFLSSTSIYQTKLVKKWDSHALLK